MTKKLSSLLFLLIFFPSFLFSAGLCEKCSGVGNCDAGLTCVDGKCVYEGEDVAQICPVSETSFVDFLANLFWSITYILVAVIGVMAAIGGFLYVTAGGNYYNIERAKAFLSWIIYAVIFIFLMQISLIIIRLVLE